MAGPSDLSLKFQSRGSTFFPERTLLGLPSPIRWSECYSFIYLLILPIVLTGMMTPQGTVSVLSKSYVFDPRPRFPFRIAAKRYWTGEDPDLTHASKEGVVTLIFIHANGYHKEHWEPTIERIFQNEQISGGRVVKIHDIWALDAPNQGDSAILNEDALAWGYTIFSWEDQARSIHAFLAGLGTGVDVDFSKRNIVLAGHSMGAVAAMLSTTYHPLLKISSMQLIEPTLLGEPGMRWGQYLITKTENRRDVWASREEALQSLRTRDTWRAWDERLLRIHTEYGLRPLPTREYPHLKDGVTLKCTKKQEAACFRDYRSFGIGYRHLRYLLKEIPTHIIYGDKVDFVPADIQDDVLHIGSGGIQNFASVTKVPGAGHLLVETHPDATGDVVWKALINSHSRPLSGRVTAKL